MAGKRRRKGTRTSAFGSPGRICHDSSAFYGSRMYAGMKAAAPGAQAESAVPAEVLDRILCKSSERMDELPGQSVHLMVTSPPYNAGKEYDEDLSLDQYRDLLRSVFRETHRVLVSGGRACVNVANLGRRPYIPLHRYIIEDMETLGFLMRGEILWNKGSSASPSTAWGSWRSAANPVLRDVHEYILVFSKQSFSRERRGHQESTIRKEDFLEWTKSVWSFPAVPARSVGHPAPFPEELPRRLIELYTYKGDVVLDPFCGSGTTCLAARNAGRHFVGYDISPEYCRLADGRLGRGP
ncbi:MAG: site-specific DNA-methyltransferase [Euryarchaeota archaeon]|nr:site-specific DNA-methyltransferase [Euryarchaeota archaeon]